MAEPTLQQVFGANATQNATTITIAKADLTGLTASETNTAESLLVAILIKAKTALTQANFDANTDQSLLITEGFPSITYRGTDAYRQQPIEVRLNKLDTSATIDPDDY
jgi:hypothetical protein